MSVKQYLFIGDHADSLHNGRPVAPGDDPIPADAVNPGEQPDKDWLKQGVLVEIAAKTKREESA